MIDLHPAPELEIFLCVLGGFDWFEGRDVLGDLDHWSICLVPTGPTMVTTGY